ncbi:tRNA(Ile)-lysidine synthase [Fundidesulfovibrio magnetotacticus]|uniref:tRNA(Ile)-lysidine synthase n=1 Tax=Fundidesulfovibrio magnetotacticus TaxID=2730080 RepID=A0A6V8LVB4_9BACT|nr:tRNA lysidine(34) synthetase TilS [Fundidesulfovibrio magnetotacticus]GFK94248.1 tRNA(Ile)-lysidine synthase [Fundidesulfovibrio magnetotacticus]
MTAPTGLQALPPWCARLCLGVERFLSEQAPAALDRGHLLVAVSAGADSTALARILAALAPRLGVVPVAVHLNHSLRPESPDDDAFCRALARELGMDYRAASRNVRDLAVSQGLGLEDAGRTARYDFFEESLARTGACVVALAHHLDDLAEDQLLRLTRGAGWPALGGMPAWDPARRVLRPLLLTPKAHLRRFLEETGSPWREDPSNADPAFTRNRIRHEVLPLLARENPDYLGRAAELWRQARQDEAHWGRLTAMALAEAARPSAPAASSHAAAPSPAQAERASPCGARHASPLEDAIPGETGFAGPRPADAPDAIGFLPARVLGGATQALRLRLYKRAVESLGPGQPLGAALRRLDEAWLARATGKRIQFPGGKEARVERSGVRFCPAQTRTDVDTSGDQR